MIKLVMCLHRHPDLTRQEFRDYWMNNHGPFFRKHMDDMRAKRYVQSLTIDTPLNEAFRDSRGMRPECDGVAEVWFESEGDMVEAMSAPDGQKLAAALLEDESRFLDHAKCSAFLVEEHDLASLAS
ncbi:MAG: EthD domain-containing protein [Phycisphaerales bacterium]|nr:EthD domain-containing protein [Phycisphaerae bacterium]NNF42866.1 EthD domain-containing protein [Phycisphaerales bacterium]NNM26857.1 EthD domain-containing protein [Phycisphaerales bacterium]